LQAANTLLFVWKLLKASGITWGFKAYVIPVPVFDEELRDR
jgi:hypothetical protein